MNQPGQIYERARIGDAVLLIFRYDSTRCRFGRVSRVDRRTGRVLQIQDVSDKVIFDSLPGASLDTLAWTFYVIPQNRVNVELFLCAETLVEYDLAGRSPFYIRKFIERHTAPYRID